MNRLLHSALDGGRVMRALRFSWAGLRAAYKKESAFRQELILATLLIPSGFWLGRDATERILLVGSVLLVLIVELLNSAVEATVDRGGLEWNKLAGRAKDMGSAAVLIALVMLMLTWGMLAWEKYCG
jgi:diacylglycerol kinase (ATP)